MVEIWIQLIVNERRWHIINAVTQQANDMQVQGDTAFYTVDRGRKHYFYFVEGGRHYVVNGFIQRNRMLPLFYLSFVDRLGFTTNDIKKVNLYKSGVIDYECRNRPFSTSYEKTPENPGISFRINLFDHRPDNAEANIDLFRIVIDEEEINNPTEE